MPSSAEILRPLIGAVVILLASCTASDDIHPPLLGSVTPNHGRPGSTVIANGMYFCARLDPEDADEADPLACENIGVVTFEMLPAEALRYTDTEITIELPQLPPGEVQVLVSVAGRTSEAVTFRVE